MRLSDLKKSKYRTQIGVVIVLIAIAGLYLGGAIPGMRGMDIDRPVTNYGDWYLYVDSTGTSINSGDTINADDGLKVTFVPDSLSYLPDTLICSLYRPSNYGWQFVETGTGGFQTTAYIWRFNLDATLEGANSYFVAFSGTDGDWMVSGVTYTFQIDNSQAAVYDDPEIIERPINAHFGLMESPAKLEWKYKVYSTSTITVTVNGIVDVEQDAGLHGVEQGFIYNVDTSVDGTYNIVFKIIPEDPNNQAISDSVIVTVELPSTTTPTTTTDTETTTTDTETTTTDTSTTTTTDEPEPDGGLTPILIIGGALIAGVIIVFFVMKKPSFGNSGY